MSHGIRECKLSEVYVHVKSLAVLSRCSGSLTVEPAVLSSMPIWHVSVIDRLGFGGAAHVGFPC